MSDAALSHTDVVETAASHVAERGAKVGRCANCESSTIGPYCAVCGQERDTHRRSVAGLLRDFFVDLINVDSRILRTAGALLFEPGELSLAFRQGRTQRYIPAMRLYLFVSLVFFLLLSATNIALIQFEMHVESFRLTHDAQGRVFKFENGKTTQVQGLRADEKGRVFAAAPEDKDRSGRRVRLYGMKADGSLSHNILPIPRFFQRITNGHTALAPDARAALQNETTAQLAAAKKDKNEGWITQDVFGTLQKLGTDPAALNGPMMTWIPRIMFLLLPAYAFLLTVFYWRKRRDFYFVDHLVFSLNIHTFGFVLLLGAAAAAQFVRGSYVAMATIVIATIYAFLAMKRFYEQNIFWTGVKFIMVSFLYVCLFALPALMAALVLSVVGGNFG